jgi:hypothetical protein
MKINNTTIKNIILKKRNIFIFIIILISLINSSYQGGGCQQNKFSGRIPETHLKKMIDDLNSKRQSLANGKVTGLDKKSFPQSSNMSKIFWNKELEKIAQNWANRLVEECKFEHNPIRKFDSMNKEIALGENLYISSTTKKVTKDNMGKAFIDANNSWWNEKDDFNVEEFSSFKSSSLKVVGHFTQMAWAETVAIGCGYALYKDDKFTSNEIVVCNYIKSGNYKGKPIYLAGKPCTKCLIGNCNTNLPGLCGGNGYYSKGN